MIQVVHVAWIFFKEILVIWTMCVRAARWANAASLI